MHKLADISPGWFIHRDLEFLQQLEKYLLGGRTVLTEGSIQIK
jgi:hypothetical protein